ncbi:hypothetical protein PsorP6_013955 [Peronosclerospora sorghi]|uniref:Uncharacterized protein n=1 Tax=Peronosclerospora sorghi TaxID=230839 RepID=A0ACC0VI86_9STRA|nr:hypothetical protein PsorP6_013955 [Peronosclerospora sorghi]
MLRFRAQLVMEFAEGSRTKLKRSKKHGELVLDVSTQSVQLVYPRVGRFYQRKMEQPLKCVIGRKLLRMYSNNGKRDFICRLVSEEDAAKCTETLRSFGGKERSNQHERQLTMSTTGETALRAIQESSPKSMQAEIRNYESSYQLKDDKDAIVRAMFSMDR